VVQISTGPKNFLFSQMS